MDSEEHLRSENFLLWLSYILTPNCPSASFLLNQAAQDMAGKTQDNVPLFQELFF